METLRLFCDVTRYQSFSQAAAEHGLTQSAVSQRISGLEKRLNVRLIDRSIRPPALTPAGDLFFNGLRDVLERYDRLEHEVTHLSQGPAGHIEVNAIYSAGIDLLNRLKEDFEHSHPRVRVDIHYKRPEEVYEAVRQERCDLGILSYPQRWQEVGIIPLREEVMAVVCRPEHPLARRSSVEAADLDAWPMIAFESGLPVGRRIKRYLRENGASPEVVSTFDNIDTITSALGVTDSFAILPRRPLKRQVESGSLVAVELRPRLVRPLGIIYHRRPGAARQFGAAVERFVEFLLDRAGPQADLAPAVTPADHATTSRR